MTSGRIIGQDGKPLELPTPTLFRTLIFALGQMVLRNAPIPSTQTRLYPPARGSGYFRNLYGWLLQLSHCQTHLLEQYGYP